MPAAINSAHAMFTIIAVGILFGIGYGLAQMALQWPVSKIAVFAAVICVLLLVIAWLV